LIGPEIDFTRSKLRSVFLPVIFIKIAGQISFPPISACFREISQERHQFDQIEFSANFPVVKWSFHRKEKIDLTGKSRFQQNLTNIENDYWGMLTGTLI